MADSTDVSTPLMRARARAVRVLRYSAIGMTTLGLAVTVIGIGLIFTPLADDSPEILVMAGITVVLGVSSYVMMRSIGPTLAADQLTPGVVRGLIARAALRKVLLIVTASILVFLFALFRQTSAH